MSEEVLVRAVLLDDGKAYRYREDGLLEPLVGQSDWERVDALTEEELKEAVRNDPDAAPLMTEEEFQRGRRGPPNGKRTIVLDLDPDVADYFRQQGQPELEAGINAALRTYIREHGT